jgi:protease I
MPELSGLRVAVLATDGVEEAEITQPAQALRDAGARVDVLSLDGSDLQMMRHDEKAGRYPATGAIREARSGDYDGVLLPGGVINADKLRMDQDARRFIREIDGARKPIAVICHAAWLLVSSGLVAGRTMTSYYTLQDDIRCSSGNWVDQEVVVDGTWVSSRRPSDIPAFNREMIRVLASQPAARRS